MGSLSSKIFKNTCNDQVGGEKKEKIEIKPSPNGEIVRTAFGTKREWEFNENVIHGLKDGRSLTKRRLVKNWNLDPRSPSSGIVRTPIFLDNTPVHKATQTCDTADSPFSTYTCNLNEANSFTNLMTPSEPSVNVSGFEKNDTTLSKEINFHSFSEYDLKNNENTNDDEGENEYNGISWTPLRVSTKPSTLEAKKLLNEILSSHEFERENIVSMKSDTKLQNAKNPSVHYQNSDTKVSDRKAEKQKYRTPLSNITLSSNSPNFMNGMKKPHVKCKIMSDTGTENKESIRSQQIAEWDKDKTVII